jgi:hypothetical protein
MNALGVPVLADRGWKRAFDEPIPLPDGRELVTLKDAGDYITKLRSAGMAGGGPSAALGGRARRPDHAGTDWNDASLERRQARSGADTAPQARQALSGHPMKAV